MSSYIAMIQSLKQYGNFPGMSQIFARRVHLTRTCLRQSRKPVRKGDGSKKAVTSDMFSIPVRALEDQPPPLDQKDVDEINKKFLSRTRGLEADLEVKDLAQIRNEFHSRYRARYLSPSKSWFERHWKGNEKPAFNKFLINIDPEKMGSNVSAALEFDAQELMSRPLQAGDLVLLRSHSSELSMCIDIPESTKDPRYTFTTVDGTIIFSTRSMIAMRIPCHLLHVVPDAPLLMKEDRHGFGPVGYVKNKASETFILPVIPRQQVSSPISHQISKKAWEELPCVLKKLELLHRHLQDARGPWQVPFFNLIKMVEQLDIQLASSTTSGAVYVNDLIQSRSSKSITKLNSPTLLSVFWAISSQQQSHLWGAIHINRALLSPVSVTILPLKSQHLYYTRVLQTLKAKDHNSITDFSRLVNTGQYSVAVDKFPEVIKLLQDYTAGNFYNDSTVISIVSKIFRRIKKFEHEDITRDLCHKLLGELDPSKRDMNPLHYNLDLGLPPSSPRAESEQKIYQLAQPLIVESTNVRHDFGDIKVYCIDSDTAHEIDDGISIEMHGQDKYTLHIHIADPASLFPESCSDTNGIKNEVLRIALEKSFTTYLPDLVMPMLPESYSKAADLGNQGKKTKTITFSVDAEWSQKAGFRLLSDTFQVRFGLVSNFPKVTYETVDSILEQVGKVNKRNQLTEIQRELSTLHAIAKELRDYRIQAQHAVIFGDGFNKGQVELSPDENGVLQKISFKDQIETPSTVLVSEMMILANTLSGRYFKQHKIPGVFRCYRPLKLGSRANYEYECMKQKVKEGDPLTVRDINVMATLLNTSYYSGSPYPHEMIGASQYLTVTSPLRRFPDMINHLQLHRFLCGQQLCFSEADVNRFVWQIQSRDAILKAAGRQSNTYWTLRYLKQLIKGDKTRMFSVMINSVPQMGFVKCVLLEFSSARATLKLKPNDTSYPKIGDIVKDCRIAKIDALEGLIEMNL